MLGYVTSSPVQREEPLSLDALGDDPVDSLDRASQRRRRRCCLVAGSAAAHSVLRVRSAGDVLVPRASLRLVRDDVIDAVARLSRGLPPLRGRGRIALVLQRRLRSEGRSWKVSMRQGHCMEVPVNSAQSWVAAFTGSYDDEEIELLIPYVESGSLVLDIGASLGFYTVPLALAARRVGARVLAFEPVGGNCVVLRRNLELNGADDLVSVLPVALGLREGEVVLHVETGGTGNATIISGLPPTEVARHDKAGCTGAEEIAEVSRLDELDLPSQDRNRRCSLVKIDVEGFEMDVLAGASSFLAANRPVIFAEFNPEWLQTRGVEPTAPQEWAAVNGYNCMELVYDRHGLMSERQKISLRTLSLGAARSGTNLLLTPVVG